MFLALLNQGAYLNNTPIRVSQTTRLDEAIVHIGDMMKEGNPRLTKDRVEEISQLLLRSRRVRMIGTAATDLAYVACGRADLLVNHSSAPWDREAGKLLLLEAGGKALTKLSRNNEKLSLYSNDFLHQEVENLLFS
jgi:myo-inositol-1(or 4)-monophosphatase